MKYLVLIIIALTMILGCSPAPKEDLAPAKTISYELLGKFGMSSGILISKYNFNEADMTILGEQLKYENRSANFAYVFIFDDRKAYELRERVWDDTASRKEVKFYEEHFIGIYGKNAKTSFNQFSIYFDGCNGSNSKTITY